IKSGTASQMQFVVFLRLAISANASRYQVIQNGGIVAKLPLSNNCIPLSAWPILIPRTALDHLPKEPFHCSGKPFGQYQRFGAAEPACLVVCSSVRFLLLSFSDNIRKYWRRV